MPVKLNLTLMPHNQVPSVTGALGISPERKEYLMQAIDLICQKSKGTFINDFLIISRECENYEEYTYAIFQYGVTVGTNLAIQAKITHKN